jgi:arylsulfatase A-like enzyme
LFTGLRPSTTGIYNNEQYWRPALPDVQTLPQWFRKHGYHAAGAGKVLHHVAGFNPPHQWDEFQLQEFDDPWYRRADFYPWNKKVPPPPGHPFNGLRDFAGEFDWGTLDKPENEYGDQKAAGFAESFLRRKREKPFFLAVGMWAPHIPLFSPRRFWDLYPDSKVRTPEAPADDLNDLPEPARRFAAARRAELDRIIKEGKYREFIRAYLAAISYADSLVGRVLSALDASRYASNTVIVFWSDNGWHLGEKQHVHKSTLWQRSTHVPMIFAGPGVGRAGAKRRQPVSLLDLYPTLIELCGLENNPKLEGTSLVPLLQNPAARRDAAVSTFMPGNHAVVTAKWRYILYADGSEELYDREKDRNEFTNLAGEPRFAELKRELARHAPKSSAPMAPSRADYDFDFQTHSYRKRGS